LGPWNAEILSGGDGLTKPLPGFDSKAHLPAGGAWSMSAWVEPARTASGRVVVAGLGDPAGPASRYFALTDGRAELWAGGRRVAGGSEKLAPGAWRFLAASSDGSKVRLYVDGKVVAEAPDAAVETGAFVSLGSRAGAQGFGGRIAGFTVARSALSADDEHALALKRPQAALIAFEAGSPTWPVQVRQMYGQVAPQDAWTLPKGRAAFDAPVAVPAYAGPALVAAKDGGWTLKAWRLIDAPSVMANGAALSRPGFDASKWQAATVPGTVLTTLVDRGVYPNPEHGLNNLAIPESLARQDYWYRTEFDVPADAAGRRLELTFNGVNYAAEVWLNGERLGDIRGAFVRGRFDVTDHVKPGNRTALAVRISPPPHPGIAQEESISAGVGENGGLEALDGPTFVATEGWDWIPSVRDRNTGLWQDVTLKATGPVRIGDPQIVTTLPKADNSEADVEIDVPVINPGDRPQTVEVRAAFDDVAVSKSVAAAPGTTTVVFSPKEFPQLAVAHPKLWWPNGYGDPALHTANLAVAVGGSVSDTKAVRFGMRQITYELSLMDSMGEQRRVEVDFARARQLGQDVVDVSHEGIRKVAGGWVESLRPGAESSPAVHALPDDPLGPYLALRVNGVRIAARGGNWGTDDFMKRSSRERLEPFFRLHRDAHLNIIRNWVGQNTEDVFYDLADEYGLLILNDFWESTEDYQLEPDDVPLFLANAADVVARYRNHPSIAVWFGRNEGVPQPALNEGMAALIHDLDGTRWYTGSSNRIELQNSGPYDYRDPSTYFTEHAKGFSVESGSPSFPTLEAFEAAVPAEDRWPISDSWAYHDWHQSGNGATQGFMTTLATQFGAASSLPDFERKAQMMNYVTYRAMFEGFNAGLWRNTSGRLLWMTQPAWPSTNWQILSHDYDTHAAFYGVMKASEPVHVQLDLPDFGLTVVNTTRAPLTGLEVRARVFGLDDKLLADTRSKLDAPADQSVDAGKLALAPLLQANGVVLVKLELTDASGKVLSQNFYWQGADPAALQRLNAMPAKTLQLAADAMHAGDEVQVRVRLTNPGAGAALATKLTLKKPDGSRILPAYYDDNYVSLLPDEHGEVVVTYPASAWSGRARIAVRGWNVTPATIEVKP
jgi:hypothetical protein